MREAKTFFDFSEMDFKSLWDENIISEDDDGDLPGRIILKTIIIIIIFFSSCSFSTCESFPSETKSFISSFRRKSFTSLFSLDSFTKIKNKEHKLLDKLWNYDFILVLSASSLCPANAFSL